MKMRRASAILLLILVTGCGFMSRKKSTIYSLDRIPPAGGVVTVAGLPVGIDSIELPPGFDRKEVVVRQSDKKLDVRETQQWSATLQPLVLHTLASDLADRLPVGMVIMPGAAKPLAMRSIDIAFEELSAGPESRITIDAVWTIRQAGRPDYSSHERLTTEIPSLDSANVATGMSQALAALADRIVTGLAR